MVGGLTKTGGTVLKGRNMRKAEKHCFNTQISGVTLVSSFPSQITGPWREKSLLPFPVLPALHSPTLPPPLAPATVPCLFLAQNYELRLVLPSSR